ncbi:MAG: endonuclease domain-containing protein [Sphingomonadaceae bacterium]|nr:endonuclease domain-containing protein [Sphingomonadaceae bacterium]
MHLPSTRDRARALRKDGSLPEALLWRELKKRPGGFKFRRQHPVGRFVADFYCHAALLAIEIDGAAHDHGDQPEFDVRRDRWFESQGLNVLRIPARDVLSDLDTSVRHIVDHAERTMASVH